VRLAGTDLFALDEDARAAVRATTLGFVFQSFQLLGNLTALENVMLPLELQGRATRARRPPRCCSASASASACATTRAAVRRRAAARRAGARLRRAPAVLLADEPTGSLDFATGEKVMQLMFDLNREAGTTLVLVTHDRGIAARCDRQLHIEAGRVDTRDARRSPDSFPDPPTRRRR
jgi:putative ABC transport system ATP-binding protein